MSIRGPILRSDLEGLGVRLRRLVAGAEGTTLVCRLEGVASDAVAVDALARLHLGARRHGCRVVVRDPAGELRDLVELMGLTEVLAGSW